MLQCSSFKMQRYDVICHHAQKSPYSVTLPEEGEREKEKRQMFSQLFPVYSVYVM